MILFCYADDHLMIHQVHICSCADMITWRWWDTSGATDDLVLDWEVDKEQMLFTLVTKCKYSDERLIRAFQIVAPSIIIQSGPIRSSPQQCNAQTSLFHTQAQNALSFVSNFKTNNTQSYFFLILYGKQKIQLERCWWTRLVCYRWGAQMDTLVLPSPTQIFL